MGKAKVNLTIDTKVTDEARALGLNLSQVAEAALSDAIKAERNRVWRAENKAALEAYAEEVAQDGLPLARFRSF